MEGDVVQRSTGMRAGSDASRSIANSDLMLDYCVDRLDLNKI